MQLTAEKLDALVDDEEIRIHCPSCECTQDINRFASDEDPYCVGCKEHFPAVGANIYQDCGLRVDAKAGSIYFAAKGLV